MKVFNARHFLRHVSLPTLRQFTESHLLAPRLAIDWSQPADKLSELVCDAVDAVDVASRDADIDPNEREQAEHDFLVWHDDLRRAHLMSNPAAIQEFRVACAIDDEVQAAFADRDEREAALWMLAFREPIFRDAELHLAFQARTNGKYWKKHRIQPGLCLRRDRASLEAFCSDVASLYKKAGAGDGVHIEMSERPTEHCIQLTIYVEGPVTAVAHFTQNRFTRIKTRIALETALEYNSATGCIETIVKGGARNHNTVLELFGKHVIGHDITPTAIERPRFNLNALRDGDLEPFDDWSTHGVADVRLRRAIFSPIGRNNETIRVEASPERAHDDAIQVARRTLVVDRTFEAEYNMDGASVIVYKCADPAGKASHFSFDVFSTGSSTIKNLSARNQPIADAVLVALNVIEAEAEA